MQLLSDHKIPKQEDGKGWCMKMGKMLGFDNIPVSKAMPITMPQHMACRCERGELQAELFFAVRSNLYGCPSVLSESVFPLIKFGAIPRVKQ